MPMPPIPPFSSAVPLVGAPCVFKAMSGPQVVIVCNCEAKSVLLINGIGQVVQCAGCKRGRMIAGMNLDKNTGQLALEVVDCSVEAVSQ